MKAPKWGCFYFFGWIVFLVIFATSWILRDVAVAAEKEPIKIGVIAGLTGVFYLSTKPCVDALNLAVKEINEAGGILGRPVELFVRDEEGKVDVGVREMKDVILRKKVDIVLGGISSSAISLAKSEVAKTYKIPYIGIAANSQNLTEAKGHRYTFLIVPNTRMEGTAVATFVAKQGYKTVWTIAPDYEWGHTIRDFSLNKLKELSPDIKVLGESWPKLGETDFTPYISMVLNAKPDILFGFIPAGDLINFTKQAKPYGLFEKMHYSSQYEFSLLRALGGEMPEGVIAWNRGEFFSVNTPAMDAFVEKFRKAFGGDYPTFQATYGYEAVYCVKQAMEKAKSTNKEKVVDALEGMEFTGPRGKNYFRACDHQATGTIYVGFTTRTPKYPFCVLKDVLEVSGEKNWLSCEEVKKLRGGK